jgi:3-methyladenine DNA glycosylase AlkD
MPSEDYYETLKRLKGMADPRNVAGMARYGISTEGTLGIPMPALRAMAKRIGKDHELALELWESGLHEGRILAALVAEPARTDRALMERWVRQFDSWDICDQVCANLFSWADAAYEVVPGWTADEAEFVRRAGFVMMAALAVHDKKAMDEAFLAFFPLIEERAGDDRNFVRKAINWAVRQMGKRNLELRRECILLSERLKAQGSPSARWIATDALRELNSPEIAARLEAKQGKVSHRKASKTR